MFEPASVADGPSGLADWPRPFVFRAAHLDGQAISAGQGFHFDLHVFDTRDPAAAYFVLAFAKVAQDGLGPGRGRAVLDTVLQLDLESTATAVLYENGVFTSQDALPPATIQLTPAAAEISSIVVRFLTPTELKAEHALAERPDFGVLLSRMRDRVSTLSALYGAGPLAVDFRAMGERAGRIEMTRCDIRHHHIERRSARTAQVHSIGGFTGEAAYSGELAEFVPLLRAAEWTGVGRHTVWGNGQIQVVL
jgi:hypothetical protein